MSEKKVNRNCVSNFTGRFLVGEKCLYFVCFFAVCNFYFHNYPYLFLSKNEYIANLSSLTPNLFVLSIPAESILVGAGFYPPFINKKAKKLCFLLAIILTVVSFVMGYRHLLFIFILMLLFKKRARSILIPLLLFSFVGEFSNVFKFSILGFLYSDTYSFTENYNFIVSSISSYIGFSGEQLAIFSNLILGMHSLNDVGAAKDALNILPLASSFGVEWGETTSGRIGRMVGIGFGQGTAYNFQLFVIETYGLALAFLGLVFIVIKYVHQSVFSVLAFEVFYYLLRSSPSFFSGQIKIMLILIIFVVVADIITKYLLTRYSKSNGFNSEL